MSDNLGQAAEAGKLDPESVVRRYYELVDASDFDKMLELFDDNAVYSRPGYEPLQGKDVLRHFYQSSRVIASGRHRLDSLLLTGQAAAVQGTFTGTLKDGSKVRLRFADFFTLQGGRIVERNTYFDAPAV